MKVFYGKIAHVAAAIAGFAVSAYAIYWLGRSDEVQQILDIVEEQGSVKLSFRNHRTGEKTPIHMYSE